MKQSTILVAEDSVITRKIIVRSLEEAGYRVLTAGNGVEALAQVEQGADVDLLLTDWQMPEMDGIELIRRVCALTGRTLPYIILLTSKSETEDLVHGLETGADDYLSKPFSPEELHARIKAGLRVLALQRRLDADLRLVGQLQLRLLPKQAPDLPGFEVAACYVPSTQASGDYYDFFPAVDGQLGLFMADVCNHGAPAAVFMAIIHAVLHSHAGPWEEPGTLLANTNEYLVPYGEDGTFATAIYGLCDPGARKITLANCGHPVPLVYRAATDVCEKVNMQIRPPLASMSFPAPPQTSVQLEAGDRLLLYTDGISEVFSPADEMFGEERLAEVLARPAADAQDVITNILAAVREWSAGAPNEDDQTMVVLVCRGD